LIGSAWASRLWPIMVEFWSNVDSPRKEVYIGVYSIGLSSLAGRGCTIVASSFYGSAFFSVFLGVSGRSGFSLIWFFLFENSNKAGLSPGKDSSSSFTGEGT
jgi:hypothetical protein